MTPDHRLTDREHREIIDAVRQAERLTSGEIRLFIDRDCGPEVLDRAAFVFRQLGMDQTEERNGILFYLAVHSRKFAVIGDRGIHARVGSEFWESIRNEMQQDFAAGEFVTGLRKGILKAGEALSLHFPWKEGDKNELPDDIAYGHGEEKL
ncbi:MAG: hypothetical protein RL213_1598 [Bacteroidota bacterium]|jgi:uncharacterized membrane protein